KGARGLVGGERRHVAAQRQPELCAAHVAEGPPGAADAFAVETHGADGPQHDDTSSSAAQVAVVAVDTRSVIGTCTSIPRAPETSRALVPKCAAIVCAMT